MPGSSRQARRAIAAGAVGTALACAGVATASPARATGATITVDRFDDPAGLGCKGTLHCSLRQAVATANVQTGATIVLPAGTYTLTQGSELELGADPSLPAGTDINVAIAGAAASASIIDAGGKSRVLEVDHGTTAAITGVTLTGGSVTGNPPSGDGGGVLSRGTLTLSDARVTGNTATNSGGGVAGEGSGPGAVTTLIRVEVDHNTVGRQLSNGQIRGCGGGVSEDLSSPDDRSLSPSVVNVIGSNIHDNTARQCAGGAIEDAGGVLNIMAHTVVTHNIARNSQQTGDVGGVYETGGSPGGVTITDSPVSFNQADQQAGGVDEDGGGFLHMNHSIVANNVADNSVGGIYIDGGSPDVSLDRVVVQNNAATGAIDFQMGLEPNLRGAAGGIDEDGCDITRITDSTIQGNTAGHAAGIYLDGSSAKVTISGSTIAGNSATALGNHRLHDGDGGGFMQDQADNVTITNSTITGNHADTGRGGGLLSALLPSTNTGCPNADAPRLGRTMLLHATVSGNTAMGGGGDLETDAVATGHAVQSRDTTSPPGLYTKNTIVSAGSPQNCAGVVASQGHNLDSGSTCFPVPVTGDVTGRDPALGSLADNGGPTQTEALTAGSPAIDAASSDCPPPATDQRGVSRQPPGDPVCDVGAFEVQPTASTPNATPTASVAAASTGAQPAQLPNTGNTTGGTAVVLVALAGCLLLPLACGAGRRR